MEMKVICNKCGKHGSVARLNSDIYQEYLKFVNAYLCWCNGKRDWWEVETKTIIGTCPTCLKKGDVS